MIVMIAIMGSCSLSYDLHPLACIFGVDDDQISYDFVSQSVQMKFPKSLLLFQKIATCSAAVCCTFLVILEIFFYRLTKKTIDYILKSSRVLIQNKLSEDDFQAS